MFCRFSAFLFFSSLVLPFIGHCQVTWTGSTDNDWHKGCNWSSSTIPTCLQDVVIPTATTVNVSGIAHCKTIALQGTSNLNITGSGKLEVSDNNSCVGTATNNPGCAVNLLPNPSFESYSRWPTSLDQMTRVDSWYKYTSGSSDYYNCGYTGPFPAPPSPLPNGTGYIGFHDCMDKEYIAVCLPTPLSAGVMYTFQFKVASPSNSALPINVGIFRAGACNSNRLMTGGRAPQPFYGCLGDILSPVLGSIAVTPNNTTWKTYSFSFTPSSAVSNVAIGPGIPCMNGGVGCNGNGSVYYYLDDLLLYQN